MTGPIVDTQYGQLFKLCDYWLNKFTTDQVTLGLADVFYDDQKQIPRTPTLCLVPDGKKRELAGVGGSGRPENRFSFYILLYVSKVADTQVNARDALVLAETIENYVHQDITSGGYLVHGFCTEVEP